MATVQIEGTTVKDILQEVPVLERIKVNPLPTPVERMKTDVKTYQEENADWTPKQWMKARQNIRSSITKLQGRMQAMLDLGTAELQSYLTKLKELYSRNTRAIWKETIFTCIIRDKMPTTKLVEDDIDARRKGYESYGQVMVEVQRFYEKIKEEIPVLYATIQLEETEQEKAAIDRDKLEEDMSDMRKQFGQLSNTLNQTLREMQSTPTTKKAASQSDSEGEEDPLKRRTRQRTRGNVDERRSRRSPSETGSSLDEPLANARGSRLESQRRRQPQTTGGTAGTNQQLDMSNLVQVLSGEHATLAVKEKLPVFDGKP
ncbi:Hypothetical predicted protein, partial [Paramuricea clavata]